MAARQGGDEVRRALKACTPYFLAAAVFSGAINLLYLASPIYLMQIYGRVLPSQSGETLVFLTLALVMALLVMAAMDAIRARVLVRVGIRFDTLLADRALAAQAQPGGPSGGEHRRALRDLDQLRLFMTGPGMVTLFDAPWMPVYILILFVLHPLMGWLAVAGAVILLAIAVVNEMVTRAPSQAATEAAGSGHAIADEIARGADVATALGMRRGLIERCLAQRAPMLGHQATASDRGAGSGAMTRFLRLLLQGLMLGLGAWLTMDGSMNPASLFAGVILLSRALAPVDQAVGVWRQFSSAREALDRLRGVLARHPAEPGRSAPPSPDGRLAVAGLIYALPGSRRPVLRGITFEIDEGDAVGVIGANAAGKSTLARLLVGALEPSSGAVRASGVNLAGWDRAALGRHIGFMPQEVGLFAGTVRQNIARFTQNTGAEEDGEAVRDAARRADVHEMILDLPQGYDTEIGEGGAFLSGGQRQRLALARALYGRPRILVLDEPNANLDTPGEMALRRALDEAKADGCTIVIVAHKPSLMNVVDWLMILQDGRVENFGPRAEIMNELRRQTMRPVAAAAAS